MIGAWEGATPHAAGAHAVDVDPWTNQAAVSTYIPHAAPAENFFDAGRGVGEDYENPFRTSGIWKNVQTPADAIALQQPNDALLRAGRARPSGAMFPFDVTAMAALRAAAAKGGLPERSGNSPRPAATHSHADVNTGAGEGAPFGMSGPQGPWRIEDPLEATLAMLDAMRQVRGFPQPAASGGATGAAVGYRARPMMHTMAPIHPGPPRVLQEIQDLLPPDQALSSPVYTRGGLRPPPSSSHDDTAVDREMTRRPKLQLEHIHSTAAAQSIVEPSPPRPQTRPQTMQLPLPHSSPPHILPPASNSPRQRNSPRPTGQYLPNVEDLARTSVRSSREPVRDYGSAGAQEEEQEATLVFPDDDYEWITSAPERQQRWLSHQKSTLCRLLRVDGRRIQGETCTGIPAQ
jgi:hypothetical protein